MKHNLIALLILLTPVFLRAQDNAAAKGDDIPLSKYANFDFKGRFAARVDRSGDNNVFLVDFSQLPTRFERVFFMNISFGAYEIVAMDATVAENRVRFMSNIRNDEKSVIQLLGELRERTRIAAGWSDGQKKQWLSENDKYK